ncbi:hypothetical protein BCEN4_660039 [Burkholderia cenocepacia]|nr:hypothetical protein BCEN4_660039 [Burkholderia cenocepacia]
MAGERRQCVEAYREAPMVHDRHTVMPPSMAIGWPVTERAAELEHANVSARARHRLKESGRTRPVRCL